MKKTKTKFVVAGIVLLLSQVSMNVQSDPYAIPKNLGDYNPIETLFYLWGWMDPPSANNPVQPEDSIGGFDDLPLLSASNHGNDGFDPRKYDQWQLVTLPVETGAACLNGSPYKFAVNRRAHTSNIAMVYEPGGACFGYKGCQEGAPTSELTGFNLGGIPDNYLDIDQFGGLALRFTSPIVNEWTLISSLLDSVADQSLDNLDIKTRHWTTVYMPYCTADVHMGNKITVYEDPEGVGSPIVAHHVGMRNQRAVAAWIKNNLQQPAQTLTYGLSAGGGGALSGMVNRKDIDPVKAYMINDSVPIVYADQNGSDEEYPSAPFQRLINELWGVDKLLDYLAANYDLPQGADLNNHATIYGIAAINNPQDRYAYSSFKRDKISSIYSYHMQEGLKNAANEEEVDAYLMERWDKDINLLEDYLDNFENFGYYHPMWRSILLGHGPSLLTFTNSDIQEQGLRYWDFVDNVLNGSGLVMQASEQDTEADYLVYTEFNPIGWLIHELGQLVDVDLGF